MIIGQRPNIFPSSVRLPFKHKLMSAWSSSRKRSCQRHLCLALLSAQRQLEQGSAPLSSCRPSSSLTHWLPWNVLPDPAPPPRLLLSALKYQSLPCEVRRDTPAAPARQGNAGISSVFGVRISLSSSLSARPSQIHSKWGFAAHSAHAPLQKSVCSPAPVLSSGPAGSGEAPGLTAVVRTGLPLPALSAGTRGADL